MFSTIVYYLLTLILLIWHHFWPNEFLDIVRVHDMYDSELSSCCVSCPLKNAHNLEGFLRSRERFGCLILLIKYDSANIYPTENNYSLKDSLASLKIKASNSFSSVNFC